MRKWGWWVMTIRASLLVNRAERQDSNCRATKVGNIMWWLVLYAGLSNRLPRCLVKYYSWVCLWGFFWMRLMHITGNQHVGLWLWRLLLLLFSCPVVSGSLQPKHASLPVHHRLPVFAQVLFIVSVMPSSHLLLWCPLLLLPSIVSTIKDFSNESPVHIRWL